jgi:hypothetical protein
MILRRYPEIIGRIVSYILEARVFVQLAFANVESLAIPLLKQIANDTPATTIITRHLAVKPTKSPRKSVSIKL